MAGVITVEFNHSTGALGALVRAATWSFWDHVSLVTRDGLLSALPQGGVALRDFDTTNSSIAARFKVDAPHGVIDWAMTQIGRPYDMRAVIGIGVHRDWRDPGQWFCSELVARAFEVARVPLLRAGILDRITPANLALSPLLQEC